MSDSYAAEPVGREALPADNGQGSAVPKWQQIAALVVLCIATFAAVYNLAGPKSKPVYAEVISVTREANGKFSLSAEDVFGPETRLYADYVNQGKGQKVQFLPVDEGQNKEDFTFELKPSPTGDPESGPRKAEVEKARNELAAKLDRLNNLKQRFLVILDYTEGMDERLKDQLGTQLNASRIEEMGKQGYEVQILFHRVSSSPSFNVLGPVIVPSGAAAGTGQQQLDEIRWKLAGESSKEQYSAITTGIFSFLHEDEIHPGDHVLVFSDGFENDPNTISFEPGHPGRKNKWSDPVVLADQANWSQIEARMVQATPAVPNLHGVTIDWYLPPATPNRERRMIAAIKIWKDMLERKGAEFRWHL